jgi:hypothetical protein
MDMSVTSVDWGVASTHYVLMWSAFLLAAAFTFVAARAFRAPEARGRWVGALFVFGALVVFWAAARDVVVVFRFASWPPFSPKAFVLAAVPVIGPAVAYAGWRRRNG